MHVWLDEHTYHILEWYYLVASNQRPAKYLKSSKIGTELAKYELKETSKDELWEIQKERLTQFYVEWEKIKEDKVFDAEFTVPEVSLFDLNAELMNRALYSCDYCEWKCNADRTDSKKKKGVCKLDTRTRIASSCLHAIL